MKKSILIFLIVGVFTSCQKKVYFNDFEKSFLDVYNEGDTLIFESGKGERDTSYILKKDIRFAEWNPLAHSGKYKRLIGEIDQANKTLANETPDTSKFISLLKENPDAVSLFIVYDDIILMRRFKKFSLKSLEKYKVDNNVFRFRIIHKKENVNTEESLYWHLKYGLVKFVTKEGIVWRRININGYKAS